MVPVVRSSTSSIYNSCVRIVQDDALVAYQIAFDLYESATQHFLRQVQDGIRGSLPAPPPAPPTTPGATTEEKGETTLETPVQETGEDIEINNIVNVLLYC